MIELNDENFEFFAARVYDNPNCSGKDEFLDDLKRFKYLKRLFKKQATGQPQRERLILNHIIVLYNLFGPDATTKMLFYKIDEEYWSQLKTFLVFLNYMPLKIIVSRGVEIKDSDITIDENIATILRQL
jgi:hypothetical protein